MIHTACNYLAAYIPKPPSRPCTHKRSELRQIYNTIVKMNKQSPLYMLNFSADSQKYALNLKDSALNLHDFLSEIISEGEHHPAFSAKVCTSTNEEAVSGEVITSDCHLLPDELEVTVSQLAAPQINKGKNLSNQASGPAKGYYSFTANVEDSVFEFQFNIFENQKNLDIQKKLVDFINKSNIGIKAFTEEDHSHSNTRIILESASTGAPSSLIFTFKDTASPGAIGITEYFGLNQISSYPASASFQLNKEEKTSLSNSFIINHALRITLHSESNAAIKLTYSPDQERVMNLAKDFISSYNRIINVAESLGKGHRNSGRLITDLTRISSDYTSELESCGLLMSEDSRLYLEPSLALQAIEDGSMEQLFTHPTGVMSKFLSKTTLLSINPMDYVDKTLVTYPDFSVPAFANPYITSIYTGLLYNYQC